MGIPVVTILGSCSRCSFACGTWSHACANVNPYVSPATTKGKRQILRTRSRRVSSTCLTKRSRGTVAATEWISLNCQEIGYHGMTCSNILLLIIICELLDLIFSWPTAITAITCPDLPWILKRLCHQSSARSPKSRKKLRGEAMSGVNLLVIINGWHPLTTGLVIFMSYD